MLSKYPANNRTTRNFDRHVYRSIDYDQFEIVGRAGSGNVAIAERVLHEISKAHYDRVIVIWSGVNRVDIPIPIYLHRTFPQLDNGQFKYDYFSVMDPVIWYHSGGIGTSGADQSCPTVIRNYFRECYVGASEEYLSTLTLSSIARVQTILNGLNIPYLMSWIYNPLNSNNDAILNSSCGPLKLDNKYSNMIDWNRINLTTCYEWCKQHNFLQPDQFHWTPDGARTWFDQVLGVNINKQ